MVNTEAIIRHAIQEGIKITVVINKIDRLILELRIKPADAYYKIKHTIEEINTFIRYGRSEYSSRVSGLIASSIAASTQTQICELVLKKAMWYSPAQICSGVSHSVRSLKCTRTRMVRPLKLDFT